MGKKQANPEPPVRGKKPPAPPGPPPGGRRGLPKVDPEDVPIPPAMRAPLDVVCVACGREQVVRNGRTRAGKQLWKCKGCGRQFVWPRGDSGVPDLVAAIVGRLLHGGCSARWVAEMAGVSESWVYQRKRELREG